MNGLQQIPQPSGKQHVCFSGDLTCSGVVPCEACMNAIRQFILPTALIGAGMNYQGQAEGFLLAWRDAWQRLHMGIAGQPETVHVVDVNGIVQALSTFLETEQRARAGQTLNATDPNLMTPEQIAQAGQAQAAATSAQAPAEAPAASADVPGFLKPEPDDDKFLLGPETDLMGPLSDDQMKKIFAKAQRMTEPEQEAAKPQEPPVPALRPDGEGGSSESESKEA